MGIPSFIRYEKYDKYSFEELQEMQRKEVAQYAALLLQELESGSIKKAIDNGYPITDYMRVPLQIYDLDIAVERLKAKDECETNDKYELFIRQNSPGKMFAKNTYEVFKENRGNFTDDELISLFKSIRYRTDILCDFQNYLLFKDFRAEQHYVLKSDNGFVATDKNGKEYRYDVRELTCAYIQSVHPEMNVLEVFEHIFIFHKEYGVVEYA